MCVCLVAVFEVQVQDGRWIYRACKFSVLSVPVIFSSLRPPFFDCINDSEFESKLWRALEFIPIEVFTKTRKYCVGMGSDKNKKWTLHGQSSEEPERQHKNERDSLCLSYPPAYCLQSCGFVFLQIAYLIGCDGQDSGKKHTRHLLNAIPYNQSPL